LQFHKEVILEFATKLCTFLSLGPLAPEAVTSSKVSHKNSTHEEPHHAKVHTMQTKNKTPCSAMQKKRPNSPSTRHANKSKTSCGERHAKKTAAQPQLCGKKTSAHCGVELETSTLNTGKANRFGT
jgi:hypothetical protein